MQFHTGISQRWAAFLSAIILTGLLAFLPTFAHSNANAQASTATPTPAGPSGGATPTRTPFAPGEGGTTLQRSVTVSGSGKVSVQPDLAILVLGVQNEAETASEALSDNNTQMQAALTALAQAGIARTDIQTQSIQLYPRYDYPQTQANQTPIPPRLVGFTASNTVEVTIRDIDNLGTILDQAVTAGSNQIQGIRFDIDDQSEMLNQARQAAFTDAQTKAQQLAGLANARLGPIITISESSSVPIPFMAGAMEARAASDVPVMPGEQEVTVDIQVTWQLQ